ncbi:MAG: hypothetical protein F4Z31_17475 [Gemmatimonadetes bacterium]|nr:hypothetical protein [Gemmatimonadota bacterium]MYE92884.1 hypothetical protein [Gemmatimonadota bacterium]
MRKISRRVLARRMATHRLHRFRTPVLLSIAIEAAATTLPTPLHAGPLPQQREGPDAAYADSMARDLRTAAVANWKRLDESLAHYTARVEQRMAATVRTALKDRVVYQSESAFRVLWQRDTDPVTQVLATRTRYPTRSASEAGNFRWLREIPFDVPFDPAGDRLLFGLARDTADTEDTEAPGRTEIRNLGVVGPADEFWFAHPLADDAAAHYRFRSGDTLTLSFPDGSRLTAVQLDVLAREADPHLISGTLWIEPESGALVRAVYQLARPLDMIREMEPRPNEVGPPPIPPMLRPLIMNVSFVSVSYGPWESDVWMPHAMRLEAEIGMGIVRVPVSFEISYLIESVGVGPGAPAEVAEAFIDGALAGADAASRAVVDRTDSRRGPAGTLVVPTDPADAETSPDLPPPIWEAAPGFHTAGEVESFLSALAALPAAPPAAVSGRWILDLPWAREGLLRYNRIEGLSVGTHARLAFAHGLSVVATGRVGLADLRPRARLEVERATVLRRLSVASYHGLRATDEAGDYLGAGNSARALFLGRDHGDYYEATGAEFAWRPPATAAETFHLRLYGERQRTVETEAAFALFKISDDSWSFRPNPIVDEIEEAGAELRLSPWWGRDPTSVQFGLGLYAQGAGWRLVRDDGSADVAAGGEARTGEAREDYVRASAVARTVIPVFGGGAGTTWRLGVEAGGGTTWGAAPVQRQWPLGGPRTLRGFVPGTVSGPTFLRGRVELARVGNTLGASFFGDAGWAGDRASFDSGDVLSGVGLGVTILDGLLRVDLARALNGPDPRYRFHVHVDAIM